MSLTPIRKNLPSLLLFSIATMSILVTSKLFPGKPAGTATIWLAATVQCVIMARILLSLRSTVTSVSVLSKELEQETGLAASLTTFLESTTTNTFTIDLPASHPYYNRLVEIRKKLVKNAEDERVRNWANAGIAQIGNILRRNTDPKEMLDQVLPFVVKYTGCNQGGLFILEEEEKSPMLNLASCYAYERKKYLSKSVAPGEGLVGQCFLEGEHVYMTQVPDNYIRITSGLGAALPNAVLLTPLKYNGEILGVLELAKFTHFQQSELDLIAAFAENIASTLLNTRTNEKTRVLLEHTQEQAEQLRSQEEEMRQNMEEMIATQEEMARKQKEYERMAAAAQENEAEAKRLLAESQKKNEELRQQEMEFRQMIADIQEMYQTQMEESTSQHHK